MITECPAHDNASTLAWFYTTSLAGLCVHCHHHTVNRYYSYWVHSVRSCPWTRRKWNQRWCVPLHAGSGRFTPPQVQPLQLPWFCRYEWITLLRHFEGTAGIQPHPTTAGEFAPNYMSNNNNNDDDDYSYMFLHVASLLHHTLLLVIWPTLLTYKHSKGFFIWLVLQIVCLPFCFNDTRACPFGPWSARQRCVLYAPSICMAILKPTVRL